MNKYNIVINQDQLDTLRAGVALIPSSDDQEELAGMLEHAQPDQDGEAVVNDFTL